MIEQMVELIEKMGMFFIVWGITASSAGLVVLGFIQMIKLWK